MKPIYLARIFATLCVTLVVSLLSAFSTTNQAELSGPIHSNGTIAQIDFPPELRLKNSGGNDAWRGSDGKMYNTARQPGKGSGLCVDTSATMALIWCGLPELGIKYRAWRENRPGGNYAEKFVKEFAEFCQSEKIKDPPKYIQFRATNPQEVEELLDILEYAVNCNYIPCTTYAYSSIGDYNGEKISHMVATFAARAGPQKLWAIGDNNDLNSGRIRKYEWATEAQYKRSLVEAGAWVIIFVRPGPIPFPRMTGGGNG